MFSNKSTKNKSKKLLLAGSLLLATGVANAAYDIKLTDEDSLSFGGYIKVDARYVDGDVAYRPYWAGSGTKLDESASQFNLFANETRFNMKYTHDDVMGFIEMDFWGGGGNEIVSNSANPRIRHAFIKYKDVLVGQTWSTFMNTSAIPESADFAGATLGLVFIRQGQVRYTMGDFQVSIENPESWGGDTANDSIPDVVARYNLKGDWGNISFSALGRQLNTNLGNTETAIGASIAGRIKTIGKDDLRFQLHQGEVGRYVGAGFTPDIFTKTDVNGNVIEEVEDVTSYLVAYRHYWTDTLRSTVLYGAADADSSGADRRQWGVNLFQNLTKQLAVGVEVGNFTMKEQDADSNYAQLSLQYVL
ncbi:DcaP family trimeric outer membrane transporter [Colwellia sp. 4_MG-2023]|uniref:DcaP family trimeric outer membrane transporter n=1 Tax=unclassified Colwellia TaxID=196834 RepID=UPI001C095C70|nr:MULTISPECIES: DcaP family trimeric outer membrane transporter [unclassified Colwellia]MBU2926567.1 hypothetical protein [Colwellia sp. C2M11]MDO6487526.1 DcaP family trimeric outer membrane transporter [Colwellia sp. 6_MG-2023]MDO6507564.1 DcaP family trimeric outer membrane transporter [Colwellia sp. 5_MG-2023]MDO6556399.1 DcaP family trimeric outer membrane transporter [Colwellia sp. 4_MG-2023]MDO6652605.1 DcaP family trimeric outer membrane transporter [Colwellia sp. 3_MG-2023]